MNKRKKHIYRSVIMMSGLLLVVVLSLVLFYKNVVGRVAAEPRSIFTAKTYAKTSGTEPPSIELNENTIYEQEIIMVSSEIDGVSLGIDNATGMSEGDLEVTLTKKGEKQALKKWNYDISKFPAKDFCTFGLEEKYKVEVGDVYVIAVQATGPEDSSIRLQQAYRGKLIGKLYIDGVEKEDGLAFAYQINNGNCNSLKYFYIMISAGVLLGVCLVCILVIRRTKIEKIAFFTILFLGSLYMFVIAPYAVPDEGTHFVTAYAQSNLLMNKEITNEEGNVIGDSDTASYVVRSEILTANSYVQYIRGIFGKTEEITNEAVVLRTPIEMEQLGYVPQVLGITIGRLIGANGMQLFFLGRLFALITYAFCMYWTIKIIPSFGKMIMFIVGVLPMTLQQAMSYNYDSILNGALFLLTAYFVYLIYEKEKVSWREFLPVVGLSVVVIPIKFIYLVLVGMGVLIPKEKFGGMKNKVKVALFIMTSEIVLIALSRWSVIANVVGATEKSASSVSTGLQFYSIGYCISHPIDTFKILFNSLIHNLSFYVETMIGKSLGWLDISIPTIIVIGFVILLLLSLLQKREEYHSNYKERMIMFGLVCVIGIVVCVVLLVSGTYIGADTIIGVQGRYFLPALPIFLLSLQNGTITLERKIDDVLILGSMGLGIATVISVMETTIIR